MACAGGCGRHARRRRPQPGGVLRRRARAPRRPGAHVGRAARIDCRGAAARRHVPLFGRPRRHGPGGVLGDRRPLRRAWASGTSKVKLSGDLGGDRAKLAALAALEGPVRVRVDANNLWREVTEAAAFLQALEAPLVRRGGAAGAGRTPRRPGCASPTRSRPPIVVDESAATMAAVARLAPAAGSVDCQPAGLEDGRRAPLAGSGRGRARRRHRRDRRRPGRRDQPLTRAGLDRGSRRRPDPGRAGGGVRHAAAHPRRLRSAADVRCRRASRRRRSPAPARAGTRHRAIIAAVPVPSRSARRSRPSSEPAAPAAAAAPAALPLALGPGDLRRGPRPAAHAPVADARRRRTSRC